MILTIEVTLQGFDATQIHSILLQNGFTPVLGGFGTISITIYSHSELIRFAALFEGK